MCLVQCKCNNSVQECDRQLEYLEAQFELCSFANGTTHFLQALYHSHPEFFTKGATTQPATGAQS